MLIFRFMLLFWVPARKCLHALFLSYSLLMPIIHPVLLHVLSRPRPPLVKSSLLWLVSSHIPKQAPPTITAVLGVWLREVTVTSHPDGLFKGTVFEYTALKATTCYFLANETVLFLSYFCPLSINSQYVCVSITCSTVPLFYHAQFYEASIRSTIWSYMILKSVGNLCRTPTCPVRPSFIFLTTRIG